MRDFTLLIKPVSADCNLRCRYCFYLDRAALYPASPVHRMDDATLEAMTASYLALPLARHLFGWQGGEPTLAGIDFFRRAVALQKQYARPGAIVANTLQTNATLIDEEMATFFKQHDFLLGVSLDGPPEVHDHYRLDAGGHGTHAQVLAGIEALRRAGTEFNILTLVNDHNALDGAGLYRYLRDAGHAFLQFIPCVEFDADRKPMPFAVSGAAWGTFLCAVFDEWMRADTRRVSVRLFDTILDHLLTGRCNTCESGTDCRAYFVVEHNADVYPCDFHVRTEWRLGNVCTDTWQSLLESPRYAEFGAHKRAWSPHCAKCAYLEFCAGGCPKNRQSADAPDHLCAGWRQFYEHALPGLRALADKIRREQTPLPVASGGGAECARTRGQPNDACPCGSGKKFKRCCGRRGS